jgi:hypothetical protein
VWQWLQLGVVIVFLGVAIAGAQLLKHNEAPIISGNNLALLAETINPALLNIRSGSSDMGSIVSISSAIHSDIS